MREMLDGAGIGPIVVHLPYFVNLAADDEVGWAASVDILTLELERAATLGAPFVVTHAGHSRGDPAAARRRAILGIAKAIRTATASGVVLIENTGGGELGGRFEDLASLTEGLAAEGLGSRIGVCLDTCHAFASGYDLSSPHGAAMTLAEFDRVIGLGMIRALHLNDSAGVAGAGRDRHANIGRGHIPSATFGFLVNEPMFDGLAGILETPDRDPGAREADLVTLLSLQVRSS
jgi:deoxyribonuclease-4